MPKRVLCSLVIVAAALHAGCFTHRYSVGSGPARGVEVYKKWHHHYLFGLISTNKDLDVKQLCPSGNVFIEDKHTFVNQLLGVLTLSIWRPTTVTVRCEDGSGRREIEVDEKLARAIVVDPLFIQVVAELYPERVPGVRMALEQLEQTSEQASVSFSAPR